MNTNRNMNTNKQKPIDPHAFWSTFGYQKELVEQNHQAACQAVDELRVETQQRVRTPLRIRYLEDRELPGLGDAQFAWESGHDHHLLICQRDPENLRPHRLATVLLRTQLEVEAHDSGKGRIMSLSTRQMRDLVSQFEPLPTRLRSDTEAQAWFHNVACAKTMRAFTTFFSLPSQLLLQERLRNRFPVLWPAQFVSLSRIFLAGTANCDSDGFPRPPRFLERAMNALTGLQALHFDHLLGGVTEFAASRQGSDGFDLARRLWDHWQAKAPAMGPWDQCAIVDEFARILDLSGHFLWVPDQGLGGPPNNPPGGTPQLN